MASYPPPFNFIAAAAVVAGGLAQVASIRNQNYSGRQFGGPVTGGTPYMVGEDGPELVVPQGNATVIPNNKIGMNSGTTNINFTINAVDAEGIDEILVSRRGLITNIIREASETNGVRSAF
jgi:SLT domain-containing protein